MWQFGWNIITKVEYSPVAFARFAEMETNILKLWLIDRPLSPFLVNLHHKAVSSSHCQQSENFDVLRKNDDSSPWSSARDEDEIVNSQLSVASTSYLTPELLTSCDTFLRLS